MSQVFRLLGLIADGSFHSGEELGKTLGITRSAIWKIIKQLAQRGLDIYCVRGRGYRLSEPVELLDESKILSLLEPSVRQQLGQLALLPEVNSTNQYLLEQVPKGLPPRSICLAEHQTAARGRRGRSWLSALGRNIYLSLSWHFPAGAASLSGLSLAVGIAVSRVLKQFQLPDIQIKWPNDVLCRKKKIAGILLEICGDAAGPCDVVIGVGLNVNNPRDGHFAQIDQPWTDINQVMEKRQPTRHQLVSALIEQLFDVLGTFEQQGLDGFKEEWQTLDMLDGAQVQLCSSAEQFKAIARGIDEQGSLLVERSDRIVAIRGGDISVRPLSESAVVA